MNFEEKNILDKNKLLSKYWLSYPTQKKHEKVYFSPKLLHQKKCHFMKVSIIPSPIRTQNIMCKVCLKFWEKRCFSFVSDTTNVSDTTPYLEYTQPINIQDEPFFKGKSKYVLKSTWSIPWV